MLTLHGTLLNIITRPAGKRKDGSTYEGYSQVQLAVEERLEDGQVRHDILTLSVGSPKPFKEKLHQAVSLPVRAYARNGGVGFALMEDAS